MMRITLILVFVVFAGSGCQRSLMPTPHLYAYGHDDTFDRVPEALRSSRAEVLYVTDRAPDKPNDRGPTYGYRRSPSLAFGSCEVEIGKDLSWDELVKISRAPRAKMSVPLRVTRVIETARTPDVPFPIVTHEPLPVEDPFIVAKYEQVVRQFHDELTARLALSESKNVFVFIHGFNNTFDFAVSTTAEYWHFMGRQGVPICYSWPAGRALSDRGYNSDRESSEFTIFHLKQFLRALAACPDVREVNILAHSRGGDVILSALRELNLEYKYADRPAGEALKIGSLVLAAPDIDFEVFLQRVGAERVGYVADQVTIYTSANDWALEIAERLTLGVLRLGLLRPQALAPEFRSGLAKSLVNLVDANVTCGFTGHSYYLESPAVSSDIILVLRDHARPGAENGRPLREVIANFYELTDEYLTKK